MKPSDVDTYTHNPGYGKKMTDELEAAADEVIDMSYQEFRSEEGSEVIETALQAVEDAPEASLADELNRIARVTDFNPETYFDSLELPEGQKYQTGVPERYNLETSGEELNPENIFDNFKHLS